MSRNSSKSLGLRLLYGSVFIFGLILAGGGLKTAGADDSCWSQFQKYCKGLNYGPNQDNSCFVKNYRKFSTKCRESLDPYVQPLYIFGVSVRPLLVEDNSSTTAIVKIHNNTNEIISVKPVSTPMANKVEWTRFALKESDVQEEIFDQIPVPPQGRIGGCGMADEPPEFRLLLSGLKKTD